MSSRPISASHLERKLRSIVGVQGDNPLPDLADVIAGLVVLESDRPEWGFPGGEVRASGLVTFNAVAGNTNSAMLHNPSTSGVLVIIEDVIASYPAVAATTRLFESFIADGADFATPFAANVVNRDTRGIKAIGDSVAALLSGVSQVAPAGSGRQFGQVHVPAGGFSHVWPGPTMLAPGTGIMLDEGVVNMAVNWTFSWRERPLEGLFELR
jgi:hypothetical protein